MKLEMNTNWLSILQPGTYGTYIGKLLNNVLDEDMDDFKKYICIEAGCVMNEIFSEDWIVEMFGNITVSNVTLHSPEFYNYSNDWLEFDMEIEHPEKFMELYERFEAWDREEFFAWCQKEYGSRSGFISFFPYEKDQFEKVIYKTKETRSYDYERSIAMLLMFEINKSNCALDSYQKDFEQNLEEFFYNHDCIDDFDE